MKIYVLHDLQFSLESWRAGAGSVTGVAEGVVLTGADVLAVPAEGVDGAGPVAVVPREARLADAGPGPGMAPGTKTLKVLDCNSFVSIGLHFS